MWYFILHELIPTYTDNLDGTITFNSVDVAFFFKLIPFKHINQYFV